MQILSQYGVFLFPVIVFVAVQTIKFIIYSLKHGWDIRYAFTHGHMPSTHTAFATSIVTAIAHYEGINSGSFAIAIALAFLIIDDATRLRMHLGDQGRYLNMLVDQLDIDPKKFPRLKERVGHRVSEVIVGAILGFILTFILIKLFS